MTVLDPHLIQLAILSPVGAIIGLFLLRRFGREISSSVAFLGFAIPAVIAVYLAILFPGADKLDGYAYMSDYATGLEHLGISLKLGLNGISVGLFLLAGIVGLAAGIYALQADADKRESYWMLLLVMQAGLMGTFASVDIFFFYFFHELALIPTFIMIGVWGGAGRRSAAMEMTIYLTLGAMLSLLGIIALYMQSDLASFSMIELRGYLASKPLSAIAQNNIFGLLLFGFGILVSLFPFHTWAPRGYAAAPTSAAMLHAGVLKKFGLYGLIQLGAPLMPLGAVAWSHWVIWLALGNVVLIGFVAIAQRDLKQMIGYSSVMHMGYCFLGIICFSMIGIGGAVLLMIAHGLSVALLFLLSTCVYKRTGTYDMLEMGGLCKKTPVLAAFFIAATMANIGLPGFANFWGELSVFVALWEYEPWVLFPAALGVVISAIYGLRAVARIFFAQPSDTLRQSFGSESVKDLSWAERLPCIVLVVALLLAGLFPTLLSDSVEEGVESAHYTLSHKELDSAQIAFSQQDSL